jgi:hypothetical protein
MKTQIEQLAEQIAELVYPAERTNFGMGTSSFTVPGENPALQRLLLEFAREVQRASIEGEW